MWAQNSSNPDFGCSSAGSSRDRCAGQFFNLVAQLISVERVTPEAPSLQ
jgi:hypothetical protein